MYFYQDVLYVNDFQWIQNLHSLKNTVSCKSLKMLKIGSHVFGLTPSFYRFCQNVFLAITPEKIVQI